MVRPTRGVRDHHRQGWWVNSRRVRRRVCLAQRIRNPIRHGCRCSYKPRLRCEDNGVVRPQRVNTLSYTTTSCRHRRDRGGTIHQRQRGRLQRRTRRSTVITQRRITLRLVERTRRCIVHRNGWPHHGWGDGAMRNPTCRVSYLVAHRCLHCPDECWLRIKGHHTGGGVDGVGSLTRNCHRRRSTSIGCLSFIDIGGSWVIHLTEAHRVSLKREL